MSRIRSIHPGIWTDDAFMSLSPFARLLYIGLWNEAWDDGVFEWKPRTLKARIFPVDSVDVAALLDELEKADCVLQYEGEKTIGVIRNFRLYQRPKKPNSSGLMPPELEQYAGLVRNQFGTDGEKSPQMEDVGGRVEDGSTSPPPVPEAEGARAKFDEAWKAFPRNPQSQERDAWAVFRRLSAPDQDRVVVASGWRRAWFKLECTIRRRSEEDGRRYEPKMSTWLTSEAWRDKQPGEREPSPELTIIADGSPEYQAVTRHRNGKPPIVGKSGFTTVTKVELELAQSQAA